MRFLMLMLAAAAAAFGQVDSGTITITASQAVPAQSDSASVQVQVTLPNTAGLDDALSLLQPAGFTGADWVSVSTGGYFVVTGAQLPPTTNWSFSKTIPVEDVPKTVAALDGKTGQGVSYSVNPANPQQPECVFPALISSAQSHGARIAEAAGMKLGAIVSLEKGVQYQAVQAVYDPVVAYSGSVLQAERVGSFLLGAISAVAPTPTCSLTVRFKLM
jgi:hypothetical protein